MSDTLLSSRRRSASKLLEHPASSSSSKSVITIRSMVFGAVFAAINASANMYFNFRYSGGLGQYWVIVVSYVIFKWLSSIPHETMPFGTRWLCQPEFTPQEHTIVTLCGTAAAFCQSLGLSGGLATLTLFYKHEFSLRAIFFWTFIAGFFGIFVGLMFGQTLVIESRYPWPVARMNAETIASFHRQSSSNQAGTKAEDVSVSAETKNTIKSSDDRESQSRNKAIKIFTICFAAVLPWYLIANMWLKFLITFPVLCWVTSSRVGQVLGEGYTGVGMPGMSLGPSIILGWNASIIALETTIWLVVGSILNFWIISPALYYSGDIASTGESNGLAVWPGGLNIYTETGAPYSVTNLLCNQFKTNITCANATFARQTCSWSSIGESTNTGTNGTDIGFSCTAGKIMLSSTMWLTMLGISWTLLGSIVEAGIDVCCPSLCCGYLEDLPNYDDHNTSDAYTHLRNKSLSSRSKSKHQHSRSSSYNEVDSESTVLRKQQEFGSRSRLRNRRMRLRGDSIIALQGVPHTASGRTSLRSLPSDCMHTLHEEFLQQNQNNLSESSTYGTAFDKTSGGEHSMTAEQESKSQTNVSPILGFWYKSVGPMGSTGNLPGWIGPTFVIVLGSLFVLFVEITRMGMPAWGTIVTVLFSTIMSYGLGALIATTAQNMAMPSAMVLQLLFGFLLPHLGEPNVVSAALSNAIVAQSLTLLNDFKMAVLLRVSTKDMVVAQMWGTLIGVVCSALVYSLVMDWNEQGIISLGKGLWANLGAEGSHLLAQLFGQYGLARIFHDHPAFMWFSFTALFIGIVAPFLRRAVPPRLRKFVPNTVLIGLAQFPPANAFSVFSGLAFALFFQVYLRRRHQNFYSKYRFVSTSGMNSGVGIGGLFLLLFQALRWDFSLNLGGPVGDGCLVPPNMPQY